MLTGLIIVLLIIFYLGFSYYAANLLTASGKPRVDTSPILVSPNYENISFNAADGLQLKGWIFKNNPNKLIIMVSGHGDTRVNSDYYGFLIAKELLTKGYSVLLYDSRGEGESPGRITFGYKEGNDIIGAVNFAKERGFGEIGIIGDSLGAISTLMVVDKLTDVKTIILDSPAAVMAPVIASELWREKSVPYFFDPGIFFFAKTFFGANINTVRPIDKIKLVPNRKFLFLHAQGDYGIPLQNSQQLLAAANPESKLVIFPAGIHIETYKMNPDLYRSEVFGWLEREMP